MTQQCEGAHKHVLPGSSARAAAMVYTGASNPRIVAFELYNALVNAEAEAARILWEHLGELMGVSCGYSNEAHNWLDDYRVCKAAARANPDYAKLFPPDLVIDGEPAP